MTISGTSRKQRWIRRIFLGLLPILVLLPSGCGDDNQAIAPDGSSDTVTAADTASASLTIRWHDAPEQDSAPILKAAALDCQTSGVENVVCAVYDTSGTQLATGGPWPCASGGGRIERIPVGQDRIFVVLAEDANGDIRYQGETPGVNIQAGEITTGVVIDAFPFIPVLSAPANAGQAASDPVSLEWQAIENADEYLVQVAQDTEFQTLIIDETTPATVYAPPNLQPSTDYFWKISAVDAYTNMGAGSEVRSFTTSDAGCTFTISPINQSTPFGGETYDISVTSNSANCQWTASESSDWISLTPASGTGDGSVSVTVSANTGTMRSAPITIAGQTHTVTQDAAGCSYSISPSGQQVTASASAYNVTVSATHGGCDWTTSENSNWITLTPTSGAGGGTVRVNVSENTGAARSAQVIIAGQPHTVSQAAAACSYTIAPTTQQVPASANTYNVSVTATHSGCNWTTSENSNWIALTPTSGAGSSSVSISVSANTGAARTAQITIAGQIHTVSQAAADCAYAIAPASQNVTAQGRTYNVDVSATHGGCDWTASENSNWITLTPASGSGDGRVRVTVTANTGAARTAQITIAGQTHTVTQDAAGCTFTIAPANQEVPAAGSTYNITLSATHGGCDWTVSENSNWISVTPVSGAGGDTVQVTVSPNTGAARNAQITIAGQTHTVDQAAADCAYSINLASQTVDAAGATYSITVTATHGGCIWAVSENANWISVAPTSGAGGGSVEVTVSANTGIARTAQITIAGQTHTVDQEAADCTYSIDPANQVVPAEGSIYDITVSATHAECGWTASADSDWISLTPISGSGNGTVQVTASANTGPARSAPITIAGQTHTVRQNQRLNTAPIIGNVSQTLLGLNDDRCTLSLPLGSLFEVTFDYGDNEGNGPTTIAQANLSIDFDFPFGVDGGFDNYTWNSSLTGDGSKGSAITWQCYRFDNNSFVDVTMTVQDQDGATSGPQTFRIDRPLGAN